MEKQNKYKMSLLKEIMNGWNNYFKESSLLFHFSDFENNEPKKFTESRTFVPIDGHTLSFRLFSY